jgi:energy-coupling factor transporter ATP-binding protein EcfA2
MKKTASDEAIIQWRVATSNLERLQKKQEDYFRAIATLEQSLEDWNGAKVLLEYLKNYKLEKRKDFILGVINSALKDIFESNYRLDIQPKETKGKSAASVQKYDIIFYQNDIEIARNDELLTSNGGGVLSIASLFFKILIGYLYSKNKFYIFDEALSQVSPQYRERLSRFLKVFCEKYGFTLVVVSQTEELEEHADLVYEVDASVDEKDVPVLNIVSTIGDLPEEDYFYSIIKNFQSIKEATFIFKGFTIIRGPNNSGKSASLRAIEAILFNNFKTDTYPRKNPGGKRLTTEITFGFEGKKGTIGKEIGLKYKSGKVMFVIEGEEYFGKSLAADKVREAVEEIGFRYIDVKNMYKNFKGPLKEQTERIAYTNQYDGLFLIGSKTSDSEKIFSFLFNTENIALAIAQAKEQMQVLSKEHKEAQEQLQNIEDELKKVKIQIEYNLKLYYLTLIEEFHDIKINLNTSRAKNDYMDQLHNKMSAFITKIDAASWLEENKLLILSLQNKVEYNNTQIELIENITELVEKTNTIKSFLNQDKVIQKYKYKKDTIDQLIPRFQSLMTFGYYFSLLDNINITKEQLSSFKEKRQDLDTEYNLCECSSCKGLGVIPGH